MMFKTIILWLIICLSGAVGLSAQTSSTHENLTMVLDKISVAYNVRISSSPSLTNKVYPKNTQITGSINEALGGVLENTDFAFKKISDKYFYVYQEKKQVPAKPIAQKPVPVKEEPKPDTVARMHVVVMSIVDTIRPIGTSELSEAPESHVVLPVLPIRQQPADMVDDDPRLPILAVKTNLLYDATSTFNLGIEIGLAPKWTLGISGNYNPWTFSDNRKMKHWLVQPEARYWLCQRFSGHFFGLHAHYAQYNMGGMLPWGFNSGKMFGTVSNYEMLNYRHDGWLAGAGVSYGYHWILGNRWGLEATIGAGYAYLEYDKYPCVKCGEKLGRETKHYFGPTKAAINLIFMIK